MIGEHQRQCRKRSDVAKRFQSPGFGSSFRIYRPRLVGIEATFDVEEGLRLIARARKYQRVMIHARQVQLHPVELHDARYFVA